MFSLLVQSLKFSKKYGILQASFPDLEKVWEIKIKSKKMEGSRVQDATSP